MKLNLKARDWHNWVSIVLIAPMLLIGFTSIFLAHKKELGLNQVDLTSYVGWLPGYGDSRLRQMSPEIRSTATLPDGTTLIGTQHGLFRLTTDGLQAVAELGGDHVRAIVGSAWGVVVAAKSGVWLEQAGTWHLTLEGDAWHAGLDLDGSVTVTLKDLGPLTSHDGLTWSPPVYRAELERMPLWEIPHERVTLGKLMTDLHTGRAFLGRAGEWIWIDLLAAVLLFLGFTGIWLWWRTQTKRRDAAVKRLHGSPAGASAAR